MERQSIQIIEYDTVTSTNDTAKELANLGEKRDLLIIAKKQTAGRGRMGRTWLSQEGEGIYMSFFLHPKIRPDQGSRLTLVMAMAVEEGIRKATGLAAGIKWPNDIILEGKKVCGILTEMSADVDGIRYLIIGAGINVGNKEFPNELAEIATSLYRQGITNISHGDIIEQVLQSWEYYYERFCRTGDLRDIMKEYNEKCMNVNTKVKVIGAQIPYCGISHGINADGELLVEVDGEIRKISSGEVSVRGVYGYV
ncbi:MAG: biotin--[acetyl-CoA-carboxylase] ligase [Lachnospiraceae bacterium]